MHSLRACCCILYPVCQRRAVMCAFIRDSTQEDELFLISFIIVRVCEVSAVETTWWHESLMQKISCRCWILMTWQQTELSAPPLATLTASKTPPATSSTRGRCFLLAANVLFLSLSASALSLMLRYRETIIRKHASDVFVQSRMRASVENSAWLPGKQVQPSWHSQTIRVLALSPPVADWYLEMFVGPKLFELQRS